MSLGKKLSYLATWRVNIDIPVPRNSETIKDRIERAGVKVEMELGVQFFVEPRGSGPIIRNLGGEEVDLMFGQNNTSALCSLMEADIVGSEDQSRLKRAIMIPS